MSTSSQMQLTLPDQNGVASLLDAPAAGRNRLLNLLPPAELDALAAASEIVTVKARRLAREEFVRFVANGPALTRVLHRYSQVVFEAVAQSAACNRMHVVEQRCARWLVMSQDRGGRA